MAATPLDALAALTQSLGETATDQDLERVLPIITRTLKQALRKEPLPDLGETEPAFGLRYDVGDLRAGGGSDGTP